MAAPQRFNPHIFKVMVQVDWLSKALDFASSCAAKELATIEARLEDGTAPEDYDFEVVASEPLALIDLISLAVVHELVSIVEHRLKQLAEVPWSEQLIKEKMPETPQNMSELETKLWLQTEIFKLLFSEELSERFPEIRQLVQRHYKLRFEKLDGYTELLELREVVNSIKHSRGQKKKREMLKANSLGMMMKAWTRNEINEEKARKAIVDVTRFLVALETAVEEIKA